MSFNKKLVSGIAAMAILSGAAFAATLADQVTIETDGTGDYLLFPAYYACWFLEHKS
jgi:hypothetical protein